MHRTTIDECGRMLAEAGVTLAFAESATAGRVAMEFSLCPDAGKFLKGGLVCYDACLKESILKVPKGLIDLYTPESAEVTRAITDGIRSLIDANFHIGITGLVGPGGSETAEKPVGTMFICGILEESKIFEHREVFKGSAEEIILQTVQRTTELIVATLSVHKCTIS